MSTSSGTKKLRAIFDRLRKRDTKEVFLLDGGTGEELIRRGVPDDRKIWSATALVNPQYHDTLKDVHTSFLRAGSLAITTNSYGVVPGVGFSPQECKEYIALSGKLGRESVDAEKRGFVFGSLGPLVESYRADSIKQHEEGVKDYQIACDALLPFVDAYLLETASCVEESLQVMDAMRSTESRKAVPLLVSFTLNNNGNTRDNKEILKSIQEVLRESKEKEIELLGILFNCCKPEAISKALEKIRADGDLTAALEETGVLLGVYANRLTDIDPTWTLADSQESQPFRTDLDEKQYWSFIQLWTERFGVKLVGGCCGITPVYIEHLKNELGKFALQ
ncbi:unnamed protein product [Cylindrotheca closterium]|uniref:Hcy-binding domain-containing protein n=1 Tax=Cylindrotheca closterium TaxID=2856 RepID=A0AAD2G3I9_9STRA|nr:unnamed protein product [Cylindrotheca closterium]